MQFEFNIINPCISYMFADADYVVVYTKGGRDDGQPWWIDQKASGVYEIWQDNKSGGVYPDASFFKSAQECVDFIK